MCARSKGAALQFRIPRICRAGAGAGAGMDDRGGGARLTGGGRVRHIRQELSREPVRKAIRGPAPGGTAPSAEFKACPTWDSRTQARKRSKPMPECRVYRETMRRICFMKQGLLPVPREYLSKVGFTWFQTVVGETSFQTVTGPSESARSAGSAYRIFGFDVRRIAVP